MEDYPRSQAELDDRFSAEAACLDYLAALRWPDGFVCPRCGWTDSWLTMRGLWTCRGCGVQTSVTAGTILHRTRKPLRIWFRAMWYITSQKYGANALGLQRILGLGSYQTAWEWLHRLRRAMVRPGRDRLNGLVEVGKTYVGGKKTGQRGRGPLGKVLVVVAVEDKTPHGIGRIRLQPATGASAANLGPAVQSMADPGSTIRTDGWDGYAGLAALGFTRQVIPAGQLKLAHLVTSLLKRWLLGTYQGAVRPSHLAYYLDEFTFRFNRRTSKSRGKLFYRLAQQVMRIEPVPGDKLKAFVSSSETDDLDEIEL